MPTTRRYHSYLVESLRDPQEAAAYLEAVLEDCSHDELIQALRNVAEARLYTSGESCSSSNDLQEEDSQDIFEKLLESQATVDLGIVLKALSGLGFRLSVMPSENIA